MFRKPKTREELPSSLPYSDDVSVLGTKIKIGAHVAQNRIVYQPMEGCDGTATGEPGELTKRRYRRFAAGGAGLIWFEATAILPEARANPRQMWLHEENIDAFKAEVDEIKSVCMKENGFEPLVVCQLTHSGRHSKPHGYPEPLIAVNKPIFESAGALGADRILSDYYLDALPERYAKVALLAEKAGFDGVDVKACHGYLMNELISAFERKGKYGGSFENRTRLFYDSVKAVKSTVNSKTTVASRFNVYDGYPYPYGLGDSGKAGIPDYTDALRFAADIKKIGVDLFNVTMGNPYYNNEANRPTVFAKEVSPEESTVRLIKGAETIFGANHGVPLVSTGWTYLGSLAANVAAGAVKAGMFDLIGFGRQSFSYPDLARDIVRNGGMKSDRLCQTCGKCTELMRAGSTPGCVIYDKDVYLELYKEKVKK